MNITVKKASTFEIDPAKKYVCIIAADETEWTGEQRDNLKDALQKRNIDTVFIPKNAKFKLVEQPDDKIGKA